MDIQSLRDSTTSPTPSTSASTSAVSKQPTYTTAGTIYKPSSSQPLQPPTRRGRSLKWPMGSSMHAELAALPKTSLSELKTSGGNSYSALQQYTPLQQNYDRAVSPFSSQDHMQAKMPADVPGIQLSNMSTLQSFGMFEPRTQGGPMKNGKNVLSGNYSDGDDGDNDDDDDDDDDDGGDGDDEDEDDEDDDDGANNNALKNLPVQSLKHLASYSNPTQKAAQKAFQRGSRARQCVISSSMGSASSNSPPCVPTDKGKGIAATKQLLESEYYALRRAQHDVLSNVDGVWSTRNSTPAPAPSEPPRAKSAGIEVSMSSQRHISGNIIPMPLTAGPPGQRQFRPLNFEKALKALNVQSPPVRGLEEEIGSSLNMNYTLRRHGVNDVCVASEALNMMPTTSMLSTATKKNTRPVEIQEIRLPSGIIDSEEESHNTMNPNTGLVGGMKYFGGWPTRPRKWWEQYPRNGTPYRLGLGRHKNEEMEAHDVHLEEWWYSGVNKVNRFAATTGLRRGDQIPNFGSETTRSNPVHGAVGDNRPRAAARSLESINMEEAGAIPAPEHSRSLIEMVTVNAEAWTTMDACSSGVRLQPSSSQCQS
ncbi:hypothetical protein E4U41_003624 [Claviceps citrina]|nr:hypothetical protein E4U41_003624 [Claviceps citrina]